MMSSEGLVKNISDASLTMGERRSALEALAKEHTEEVRRVKTSGRLTPIEWPGVEQMRAMGGDELFVTAFLTPDETIKSALTGAALSEADQVVFAARLAHAASTYDPVSAIEFEPLVRALIADTRRAFPHLPQAEDTVGKYVQELHLQILGRMGITGTPAYFDILLEAIGLSLRRGCQHESLYNPFMAWIAGGGDMRRLVEVLLRTLGDRQQSAGSRMSARQCLDLLTGIAASDSTAARIAEGVEEANRILVNIMRDRTEDALLKLSISEQLKHWSPLAIIELQAEGLWPKVPVPSRRVHKDWTPATLERLSTELDMQEVLTLLKEAMAEELDRIVSALRIAPYIAAWRPGAAEELAPLVLNLIRSRLEVPMKSKPLLLGSMASDVLPALFAPTRLEHPGAEEIILEGARRALERGWDLSKPSEWWPDLLSKAGLERVGDLILERLQSGSIYEVQRAMYIEVLKDCGLDKDSKKIIGKD